MIDEHPEINEAAMRAAYRISLEHRAVEDPHRTECVSPEELLGAFERTLDEADRMRVLRHVGSCLRCRQDLELLRRSAEAASEIGRPAWRKAPMLAAAASVLLIVGAVAVFNQSVTPTDVPRVAAGGDVNLLTPAADEAAVPPLQLMWMSVPDAGRYEVELLNRDGGALFVTSTRDTALVIPDSVRLEPGAEYRWWVRAMKADGSQPASAVRRLRIATP